MRGIDRLRILLEDVESIPGGGLLVVQSECRYFLIKWHQSIDSTNPQRRGTKKKKYHHTALVSVREVVEICLDVFPRGSRLKGNVWRCLGC